MRVFEIKPGENPVGLVEVDPSKPVIRLGAEGRGRDCATLRIPPGAKYETVAPETPTGRATTVLVEMPGCRNYVLLVIRDHSGYRGDWMLEQRGPQATMMAQGSLGYRGNRPEYALLAPFGWRGVIYRTGRLDGAPAKLEIRVGLDGAVSVVDATKKAEDKV